MNVLKTGINTRSPEFAANRAAMRAVVDELRGKFDIVRRGGGEVAAARHKARGKLLARERIDALLDPGAGFLEVGQLAANGLYGDDAPSAGVIAGSRPRFGRRVHDRRQ